MPPKRTFFNYQEEDVFKAIDEISKGAKIRETCRKYNIPHTTVINKMKLKYPVQRKMGPPTMLTKEEESLLKSSIIAMAKKGFPVNKEMVVDTVKKIITEENRPSPFKQNTPGRKWFSGFLKRHPDIAARHAESINISRTDILEDPERIINADESGFQTSRSSGLVLGPRGFKNFYEIKEKEKENITVLGTFAASGTILPPLIIYPYARIPSEIVRQINKEWSVGKSEKGWMTSKVFYGYIANTLIPKLKENNTKFPVLLLIDGHKSHINREVSQLCKDNGIILYSLYPNATHIIQPADVSVFRPLKNSWKKVVNDWKLKTGHRCVTKALFAPLLEATFNDLSKEVICNGFRKCGLYPFDANAISYEKCMTDATRHGIPEKPAVIGPEHLLYLELLMSSSRGREFRANQDSSWTGDESAKELFYVWQKIAKRVMQVAEEQEPNLEINPQTPQETLQTMQENIPTLEENVTPRENDINLEENHQITTEQINEDFNSNVDYLNIRTPSQPESSVIINTKHIELESPSTRKHLQPISPAFASAIVWPSESPVKGNQKRRKKVRLPDAVNSGEWMQYWNEKEDIKKKQEEKKALKAANRKMSTKNKKKGHRFRRRNTSSSEKDETTSNIFRL
ncbi:uncharacterized protein LOC135143212 [Zophobas morio]|uniref:uncharacterized protein LOC135143212 n=1 Tax=Zophobas morio TaxID=2755281 RepID=UPI003082E3A5